MNYVLLAGRVLKKEDNRISLEVDNVYDWKSKSILFCKGSNPEQLNNVLENDQIVIEGSIESSETMKGLRFVTIKKLIDLKSKN